MHQRSSVASVVALSYLKLKLSWHVSYTHLDVYKSQLSKEMAIELFKPFVMKELAANGTAHNIKSAKTVSYTHLDVYKRQLNVLTL